MYAIIRTGGKQYKVEKGQRLEVEQLRRELSRAHADIEQLEQQSEAPPKKAIAKKAKPTKG
jgi:hypothetical protein